MALLEQDFKKFKETILQASKDVGSNELHYSKEWIFDLPGHDLKINGESIIDKYQIPTGWNGFGQDDLEKLVSEGLLVKTHESDTDPLTQEKLVIYQVTKAV